MKHKKLLALLLAATMVAVPCTAQASSTTPTESTTEEETLSGGNIDGEGSFEPELDREIYSAIIPTNANLDFKMDPQGLLGVGETGGVDAAAGKIVFNTSHPAFMVRNESAFPVKFGVTVKVTDKNNQTAPVTLTADSSKVNEGKDNNMYVAVVPVTTDPGNNINPMAVSSNMIGADKDIKPVDGSKVAVGEEGAGLTFAINKAEYKEHVTVAPDGTRSYTYEKEPDSNGDIVGFMFEGLVNKNADWKEFNGNAPTKTLKISATYSLKKMKQEDYDALTFDEDVNGLIPNAPATPGFIDTTKTTQLASHPDVTYRVSLGKGDTAATSITQVAIKQNGANVIPAIGAVTYSYNNGIFTLKNSAPFWTNGIIKKGTYTIVLTFNNSATSNATLVVE